MAEEKITPDTSNLDDVSVLRELLHNIRGISPVSTTDFLTVPITVENNES